MGMQMTDLHLVMEQQTKENKANIDILRATVHQLCVLYAETVQPGVMDCDSLLDVMRAVRDPWSRGVLIPILQTTQFCQCALLYMSENGCPFHSQRGNVPSKRQLPDGKRMVFFFDLLVLNLNYKIL